MEVENSIDQKGDKIVIGFPDLGGCAYNLCSATIFIFAWLNFFFFFFSPHFYMIAYIHNKLHIFTFSLSLRQKGDESLLGK